MSDKCYDLDSSDNVCADWNSAINDTAVSYFFQSLELQRRLDKSLPFGLPVEFDDILEDVNNTVPYHIVSDNNPSLENIMGTFKTTSSTSLQVSADNARCATTNTSRSDSVDGDDETAVDYFFTSLQLQSRYNTGCNRSEQKPSLTEHAHLFDPSLTDFHFSILDVPDTEMQREEASSCHQAHRNVSDEVNIETGVVPAVDIQQQCNCTEYDFSQNSISGHGTKHHNIACTPCTRSCESKTENAKDDCLSNTGKNNNFCVVCNVHFGTKYSYARHLITKLHERRAAGYCQRGNTASANSTEHANVTSSSTASNSDGVSNLLLLRLKPVQCRICNFYGDSAVELEVHVDSEEHLQVVQNAAARLYCVRCKYSGSCDDIAAHLKKQLHVSTVIKSGRPCVLRKQKQLRAKKLSSDCKCSFCARSFRSCSNLTVHVRRRHTKERPFLCTVCSKSYADNSTLKLHKNTTYHHNMVALNMNKDGIY